MPRIASLVSSRPVWLSILLFTVSCGKSSPSVPSSTDSDDTNPKTTDPADASTDTETGSVDTVPPGDSDTDTDTVTTVTITPELLYQFPTEERTANFGSIAVDEAYVYFQLTMAGLRASKEGGGEITTTGISPTVFPFNDILFDDPYIYWGTRAASKAYIHRVNKDSGESDIFYPGEWEGNELNVIAQDEDYIYFAGYGCANIVTINKDGTVRTIASLERDGYASGVASVAVDENYVYCGGGSGGSTRGKMYRSQKFSQTIEEFTQVTEIDSFISITYTSQIGSIAPVGDTVYYINAFSSGANIHRLNSVPIEGGISTVLAEFSYDTSGWGRLMYDSKRESLYWFSSSVDIGFINRYSIKTGRVTRSQELPLGFGPGAMDEDYFYWYMKDGIYRTPLF